MGARGDFKVHSMATNKLTFALGANSTKRLSIMEADLSSSSISNNDQGELLKSAKAKMGEIREENDRLKKLLAHIVKEYQTLEKQVSSMARSKHTQELDNSSGYSTKDANDQNQDNDMVSLSLGSGISNKRYDDDSKKQLVVVSSEKRRKIDEGLELGLDCKFEQYPNAISSDLVKNSSMENGNCVKKEDEIIGTWPPSRDLKAKENGNSRESNEESLHQPQVKKTRVCIRSRCDSPTIHDGCQWRKYGQKIAKGNPCPRAYYRCTVSSNCPVRKQVQRCPHDMSILITTYEGTHNHPLPLSATAMASATSAAAAMLKTGSLTSQQTLNTTSNATTTSSYGLHNSSNLLTTTFNNNPSMISAASHNSHPTVTLDLTTTNPDYSPFSMSFASNYSSSTPSRNSSSAFLNFASSSSCSPSLDFSSSVQGTPNKTGSNGYLNYGTLFPYNDNNEISRSIYQSLNSHQQALNETIAAAATKAIASNPNFQSVLEAAISSYVGTKTSSDNKKTSPWSNSSQSEGGDSLMLFPTSLSRSKSSSPNNEALDTKDHNR